MWTPHFAETAGAPHQAEWLCPRPGRDGPVRSARERDPLVRSGGHSGGAVKPRARLQHRVHRDCQLAGDRDGGTLEANPLLESEPQVRSPLSAELRVRITAAAS
jgi:hypothetical protein